MSHVEIINQGIKTGFYPRDLFILLATHRAMSDNMKIQQHARKFHCYFIILEKKKNRVSYTEPSSLSSADLSSAVSETAVSKSQEPRPSAKASQGGLASEKGRGMEVRD